MESQAKGFRRRGLRFAPCTVSRAVAAATAFTIAAAGALSFPAAASAAEAAPVVAP